MFSLPNFLTAGNLLCGVISIMLALHGHLNYAVYILLIAMVLDFLDGFAARLLKKSGDLGKQLDSLADMVSFGVAPGILMFVVLIISAAVNITGDFGVLFMNNDNLKSIQKITNLYFDHLFGNYENTEFVIFSGWNLVLPFVSLFIPFFSLFRLAKFNLDTRQSHGFLGVPTPANTLFFMGLTLIIWDGLDPNNNLHVLANLVIREQLLMTLIVIFSVLLVTEIPLISLKFKSFDIKLNWEKYSLILLSIILIFTLKLFALPFIVLLYLLISVLHIIVNKNSSHEIQS